MFDANRIQPSCAVGCHHVHLPVFGISRLCRACSKLSRATRQKRTFRNASLQGLVLRSDEAKAGLPACRSIAWTSPSQAFSPRPLQGRFAFKLSGSDASSRVTVTRSRKVRTCFPFHQTASQLASRLHCYRDARILPPSTFASAKHLQLRVS